MSKVDYKKTLTPQQYHVTREGGTEAPFTGKYCKLFETGIYSCICCKTALFSSEEKYDSGGGWPDFKKALDENLIIYNNDYIYGKKQIEVKCKNCDAHLGHVFNDGPPPDFKRY